MNDLLMKLNRRLLVSLSTVRLSRCFLALALQTELSVDTHTHTHLLISVLSPPKAAVPPKHRLGENSKGLSEFQIQQKDSERGQEGRKTERRRWREGISWKRKWSGDMPSLYQPLSLFAFSQNQIILPDVMRD